MCKIKQFIRDNETMMLILSAFYRLFGFNRVKGGHELSLDLSGAFCHHVKIINHGSDNIVEIGRGCRMSHCKIQIFGDGNRISINRDCECKEMDIWISDGATLEVGCNTHFTGKIHIACIEGKTVEIGEKCLFSNGIVFRTGDSHSIIDDNGQRINNAEDIHIDDHVWIGQQVIVLKGAVVGAESIIGTRSIVTGRKFESHVILAGSPAEVIRRNVSWHHELL